MTDFFTALEAQLHEAAKDRVAHGRRRRRGVPDWRGGVPGWRGGVPGWRGGIPDWLRGAGRALPVAAGVALALAVAVIALVDAGHHSGSVQRAGTPPGPALRQEWAYIGQASRHARKTAACRPPELAVASTLRSISPALLSTLGVLRRPATPADKLPAALRGAAKAQTRGVFARFIRLARVTDGISYYIVPAAADGGSPPPLTPRCAAAMRSALHAELHSIPEPLRAPTLALQRRLLITDTRGRAQTADGVVCLLVDGPGGAGGTCGASVQDISRYGLLSGLRAVSGIVPDGVVSVVLRYPAANGNPARAVTADVVNNVFAASGPPVSSQARQPTIVWRDHSGTTIRTVPPSAPRTGKSSVCQSASGSGGGVC
jgi:hypothetical protein